ncbi:MAG: ABC transporter permease subunit, partial [Candidatus Hydrogenedentes bacterium]|nr:ABC transporter permease subunit [Candidatus Hydrogenedentota bacterium]
MRNTWAVCKREFASYFLTPTGYVSVGLVALLTGLAFSVSLFAYEKMSQDPSAYNFAATPDFEETFLSPFLVFCGMVVMFLSPLLTMRLMAEERNRGTIELLLTWPLRDRDIIFGKYLAALGMLAIMLLVLVIDMALVAWVTDVEPAVLVLGLATVFLMGAAVLSLG